MTALKVKREGGGASEVSVNTKSYSPRYGAAVAALIVSGSVGWTVMGTSMP
jgi:hypothetical protein